MKVSAVWFIFVMVLFFSVATAMPKAMEVKDAIKHSNIFRR